MALSKELKDKIGIRKNTPKVDWHSYSGIIATPPKFGKTTIARLIPNSLYLACEPGYDSLEMEYKTIGSWQDFIDLIDVLEENIDEIGSELKVVIFDTVHELWNMCDEYILNRINKKLTLKSKSGVETVAQYDFRNGLKIKDTEFKKQKMRLQSLGLSTISMSHLVKKKIKPEDEDYFHSLDLDYDENLYNILVKDASYVLIGQNIKEKDDDGNVSVKRRFISKNDGVIQGGSRVHFGDDIDFDTEGEFLEKFKVLFENTIMEKNNLKKDDFDKLLNKEEKELKEKRKEVKTEKEAVKTLIEQIKQEMKSADEKQRIKVLNFLLEEYGSKKISVLGERTQEELQDILSQLK